ncbi:TPA: hypothetical protein MW252_003817 [Acinetobacter nosocomialis]|nr:hypothetical protein [Acinetobacter nosocomialis]
MSRFLDIAEKIFLKIEDDNLFSDSLVENLNCLIPLIRKALKGTGCKLKHNFIDFEECMLKSYEETGLDIDFSLMPNKNTGGEFILWLAGFIEKISEGGKPKLPPTSFYIPPGFKFLKEVLPPIISNDLGREIPLSMQENSELSAKQIEDYFLSQDFSKFKYINEN